MYIPIPNQVGLKSEDRPFTDLFRNRRKVNLLELRHRYKNFFPEPLWEWTNKYDFLTHETDSFSKLLFVRQGDVKTSHISPRAVSIVSNMIDILIARDIPPAFRGRHAFVRTSSVISSEAFVVLYFTEDRKIGVDSWAKSREDNPDFFIAIAAK